MSDLQVRNVISDAMHEAYRDDPNGADAQDILTALKAAGYTVVERATTERRVMTPQGTTRPVRPGEQLGEKLRSLGWWIEERQITEWRRVDEAEVIR